MASIPEPLPQKGGLEVTPSLLEWLQINKASNDTLALIQARHQYGLEKYGQCLMTEDGRNTMEDARQEAGDLLQYLYKALLREEWPSTEEHAQLKEVLLYCQVILEFL